MAVPLSPLQNCTLLQLKTKPLDEHVPLLHKAVRNAVCVGTSE